MLDSFDSEKRKETKMPPEVQCPRPEKLLICSQKTFQRTKKMSFTGRRIIPFLVLILAAISLIRLLRITVITYSSPPRLPDFPNSLLYSPSRIGFFNKSAHQKIYPNLTEKEFLLLANSVAERAPCNLLIFGFHPKYLSLSSINANGTTVILEDDPSKIPSTTHTDSKTTRIYKVEYWVPAKDAYALLKHARKNTACRNTSGKIQRSKCKLALKNLPQEVYELAWDVVVVDGPSGDSPEAPGRMSAIYTAALLARTDRKVTAVLVHDVDRMIERWFSWEFLCDENLISSKGRLWNFGIRAQLNSTEFCPSV